MVVVPVAVISGCLVLASCNGDDEQGAGERLASGCSQAVGQGPTVELRFRVEGRTPKAPRSVGETMSAFCARVRNLDLSGVQVRRSRAAELVVRAPRDIESAVRAAAMPGELHVYDWEPNIVGGRGPDRPYAGGSALYQAVKAASRAKPRVEAGDIRPDTPRGLSREQADRRNDTAGDRYYLFGANRRLIAGPAGDRATLSPGGKPPPSGRQVLRVPRGIVVVEAGRAPNQPSSVQRLHVLEDDSELSSSDIRNPRQDTDPGTGEPIVTMEFTEGGRAAFASLTKWVAERGAKTVLPPGSPREAALQHFALTLDHVVVSLAAIDFRENPEGIDGRTGAQINGIGSVGQTRRLARLLNAPRLPGRLILLPQP